MIRYRPFREKIYLVFICLLFPLASTAQYEALLHKPYAEKIGQIHRLYVNVLMLDDSLLVVQKGEEIKRFARKHRDRELELEVDLFLTYRYAYFHHLPSDESIKRLDRLVDIADKENIWHIKVRAIRVLAEYYWKYVKNYELAFEQYFLLDKILNTIKPEDYPEMARDLLQIGESYYFFHDYPSAKKYFQKMLALPETDFNTLPLNSARNTLGLCYQHEKKYDSADYYFNQVLQTPFAKAKKEWERIATGNIGASHYYRKEYDKAIPLLEYDYSGALKIDDYGPAAGASILLADIFLSRNNRQQSWIYILSARENIEKAGQQNRLQFLYPIISKWYSLAGNKKKTQLYLDSAISAINDYYEEFNAMKVLQAQQKITRREEALRLTALALERQEKANERFVLVSVVAGLCIIIALSYFVHKRRQLAKDLKLQAAQQRLKIARLELQKYTESMAEKNRMIQQLQTLRSEEEQMELLYQLQQSSILTDEDWTDFQRLFEKAHPGFIQRTKQAYPDLSLGELRYFVLSKLNFSYKEMASMLGVSPNTVQVLRHRIRKKLSFSNNEVLEEVINSL